jgi:hypothetical protein
MMTATRQLAFSLTSKAGFRYYAIRCGGTIDRRKISDVSRLVRRHSTWWNHSKSLEISEWAAHGPELPRSEAARRIALTPPKLEDAAEVQLSSRPGPQPIQSGAASRHPARLQAEALGCIAGVAAACAEGSRLREGVSRHPQATAVALTSPFREQTELNALSDSPGLSLDPLVQEASERHPAFPPGFSRSAGSAW